MLPKRLFIVTLIFAALAVIPGCATTGKSGDPSSSRYRIATDECIKAGHRRGSYDFNRCVERIMESGEESSPEQE